MIRTANKGDNDERYLSAVFVGSKTSAKRRMERAVRDGAKGQGERGHCRLEGVGGEAPGRTRRNRRTLARPTGRPAGIADVSNEMGAFVVVRAESHEAAARLFENHPHFAIFPGEAVEIMPVLPIPGG